MRSCTPFAVVAIAGAVGLGLAGCTAPPPFDIALPAPSASSASPSAAAAGPLVPADTAPTEVATGLRAPWEVLRLGDGTVLVSERDTGVVDRLVGGTASPIGTVPGVAHRGEGGLLGLAYRADAEGTWLYAYLTTASDNRIVRMPYTPATASAAPALGTPAVVLAGLAAANVHNGGRIAFGPDGMLYATVGDAGVTSRAQDPSSLNGKILRMTPTGSVPADNPTAGSLVYSSGHRNPQGLAWDAAGQLWAAEFGQNTWDELNRITPGANYGWPTVEGIAHDARFVDPVVQWATAESSPSGIAIIGSTVFVAALKGQRVWTVPLDGHGGAGTPTAGLTTSGRIRQVVSGPDGTLWVVTNNTDGRGTPRPGDDRILQVGLVAGTPAGA